MRFNRFLDYPNFPIEMPSMENINVRKKINGGKKELI